MRRLIFLALLAVTPDAQARAVQPVAADTALHGYVLGRYALADDQLARAARFFDDARSRDPGRAALVRRSFDLAVASGERERSFTLARQLADADQSDSDVALVRLADAVVRKDWRAADAARGGLADAGYAVVVGPIVDAWTLFDRGKRAEALARLDPAGVSGFARSYMAEQRAHMLAADGQWAAAAAGYADLRGGTGVGIAYLRIGEADARAMGGEREAALKLLAGDDPAVAAARQRLVAGNRIGALAPGARRGIGWMTARLASDLSRDKPVALALLFARVGTFLAPDIPATWLICGDVLARSEQREAALAAYARVPLTDALADAAQGRRAEVLEGMGRGADAGAILKAATEVRTASPDDWMRLGDWHRRASRFPDAISAYTHAITLAAPDAARWGLYFLRGSMNERAGNWSLAERDLREALVRSPDEPVVLNYLGYSLLDRTANNAEAAKLIERAAKLRPGDGGIIDSLGWSQYRSGRYAEAVGSLEKAAALEAADPVVNEHLGDAYWRTGRRIEARFRWRAALDLDPDEAQRKSLMSKLDYGLDAALAMAATVPK